MFVGGGFTLATTFVSMNIKDYSKQLEQVCVACNKYEKCKDKTKVCYRKTIVFNVAQARYKRLKKKGVIK